MAYWMHAFFLSVWACKSQRVSVCIFLDEFVCWCKGVYTGHTPTVTQSPKLLDVWRWARTQTCRFCVFSPNFPSIRCAAQPQISRSHRGILLWVDLRTQSHLFTGASQTLWAQKEAPFDRGGAMETGTDHKVRFLGIPVPGITPESRRRQRSSEDRGVGVQRPMWFFRRPSDWLERNRVAILVKCTRWMLTSLWGCSRVHSLKKRV